MDSPRGNKYLRAAKRWPRVYTGHVIKTVTKNITWNNTWNNTKNSDIKNQIDPEGCVAHESHHRECGTG